MKEKIAKGAQKLINWSRSNHASSVVAGLGCAVTGGLMYLGTKDLTAILAGGAVLLIFVPIANAID